jgi:hypothetical protein
VLLQLKSASAFLPATLLALFSVLWVAFLTMRPADGQPVAAIFPPIASSDRALAAAVAAGAEAILGFGGRPFIVVMQSSDRGLIHHLYSEGALLVVRAPAAAGCLR